MYEECANIEEAFNINQRQMGIKFYDHLNDNHHYYYTENILVSSNYELVYILYIMM